MNISSRIIRSYVSSHKPISLSLKEKEYLSPLPYRFNTLWLNMEEGLSTLKQVWSHKIKGSLEFTLESKLKAKKRALKRWP